MKKIARILCGILAMALLSVAIMPFGEKHAAATMPMPVSVSNTPLPLQGTVSVSNTASVNVANTPSVNVSNSAVPVSGSVSVTNPLDSGSNPIPLLVNSQRHPYQDSCTTNLGGACAFVTIQNNMRLVIQEVDLLSNTPPSAYVNGGIIDVTINGTDVSHRFVLTQQSSNSSFTTWIAHQPLYTPIQIRRRRVICPVAPRRIRSCVQFPATWFPRHEERRGRNEHGTANRQLSQGKPEPRGSGFLLAGSPG